MGRVFLDHPNGTRVYSCANCDTPLTNRSELVSTVSWCTVSELAGSVEVFVAQRSYVYCILAVSIELQVLTIIIAN